MSVADSEYDGVFVITDNHYLRDYHRSAEKQQQQQTVRVVTGNAEPPIATGPEVHQFHQPMAPPALQQSQHQQQLKAGDVGLVSVSSRKHRKLQDLFREKSIQEKCILAFIALLGFIGFILTFIKIRGVEYIKRSINVEVEPCDNFYEFACGNWHLHHKREFNKPNNWFIEKTLLTTATIIKILERPDSDRDLKSMKQARRLYRTCLDKDTLGKLKYEPVFNFLEKVGLPRKFPYYTVSLNNFHVEPTLALIQRYLAVDIMFQVSLNLNPNTNRTVLCLGPVTTILSGLPEPLFDYRRNQRQQPSDISDYREVETNRLLYAKIDYMVKVITTMFPLEFFDIDTLKNICFKIIFIEVRLKREFDVNETPQEFITRDLSDYMHSNSSDLEYKLFDWKSYIDYFTLETNFIWTMDDIVLVRNPNFFLDLQWKLTNTPEEEIAQFLWWKVVENLIQHTTDEMTKMRWKLNTMVAPLAPTFSRSRFCTSVVRYFMKGPIAYEFYIHDDQKDTTEEIRMMIKQLQEAFSGMVSGSNWTDEATKQMVTEKANALKVGVGYPIIFDSPEELDSYYDHIIVQDNQYLQSMLNVRAAEVAYLFEKLGENYTTDETDLKTFTLDPLEVNAYYNRLDNSINIPSGILQVPFFFKEVESVVNYGAIGAILGHEISHGFDLEGKDYDIYGKKTSQWSKHTVIEYLRRAQCFIDQYNKFLLDSNNYLNGTRTLSENMADNVGLKLTWKAYKSNYVGGESRMAGLTEYSNDQLFFLSFANVWCQNSEDAKYEKSPIDINDHSPSYARVLGSLRNSPEFAEAWKCPVGSSMNPSKKCSMW